MNGLLKMFEGEQAIIYEAEQITHSTYNLTEDGFLTSADLIECIDELISCYKNLQDEFNDFKQEVEDNYKLISKEEQYDYGE